MSEEELIWFIGRGANKKILTDLVTCGPLPLHHFLGGSDWQELNSLETDPETLAYDGPLKHWFEPLQGLQAITIDQLWTVSITDFGKYLFSKVGS
jgi:hypothetical protein